MLFVSRRACRAVFAGVLCAPREELEHYMLQSNWSVPSSALLRSEDASLFWDGTTPVVGVSCFRDFQFDMVQRYRHMPPYCAWPVCYVVQLVISSGGVG